MLVKFQGRLLSIWLLCFHIFSESIPAKTSGALDLLADDVIPIKTEARRWGRDGLRASAPHPSHPCVPFMCTSSLRCTILKPHLPQGWSLNQGSSTSSILFHHVREKQSLGFLKQLSNALKANVFSAAGKRRECSVLIRSAAVFCLQQPQHAARGEPEGWNTEVEGDGGLLFITYLSVQSCSC